MADAVAATFLAPSMHAKTSETFAGLTVFMASLGGYHDQAFKVLSLQTSKVNTVLPTTLLAAPQQSPVSQVFSFLFGLMVPLERAFSHLASYFPAAGPFAATSASMVLRLAALVDSAAARVFLYLSNSASLHATTAARSSALAVPKAVAEVAIKAACAFWLVMAVARAVVLVAAAALDSRASNLTTIDSLIKKIK